MTEGLMLAATPARWEWLKNIRSKGRYMGMQVELVSLDEAARLLPLIDKGQFVGAMYDPIQGHVDPNGTTHAFAIAARKAGAEVHLRTRVLETRPRPDGGWDVVTDRGTIVAEHIVNAGGLWAREVGRMAGLELPILAMEHQYLITEDMPEVAEINRSTGKMVLHAVDFDGEIYMRQERGGMLLGTYERHGVPGRRARRPGISGRSSCPTTWTGSRKTSSAGSATSRPSSARGSARSSTAPSLSHPTATRWSAPCPACATTGSPAA
jgi:dimethylglycine dehydrogenase